MIWYINAIVTYPDPYNRADGSQSVKRLLFLYGVPAGLLVVVLRVVEYRFLVIDHAVAIYGAIIAALFAAVGITLGIRFTRQRVVVREVTVEVPRPSAGAGAPFAINQREVESRGITPRELEILALIAEGLSTREMAERLFVSENTVKTHCARLFDKLGVNRRTKAVQVGKALGLIA
jgi:DNA-binding CsgD family transcriptional regulator